ncbi:MAG: hypothetical protein WCV91_05580 [Candidatus Margulisiibacteriota bacterium]
MKKIFLFLTLITSLATSSLALTVGYESGIPYLRFGSIAGSTVDLGVSTVSYLSGDENMQSALLRLNKEVTNFGSLKLGWGLELMAVRYDIPAAAAQLVGTLYSGLFTAEYAFSEQIGVYANFRVLNYTQVTLFGDNTADLSFLGSPGSTFTGVRIYL